MRVLLLCLLLLAPSVGAQVWVVPIKGIIGPASSDFLVHQLEDAAENDVSLVVIQLDTPGGLDTAMREMIQAVTQSPVPVATYVSPSGARAASAGTYLLLASHVAAMSPGTNLGAASPVAIGMPSQPTSPDPDTDPSAGEPEASPEDNDKVVAKTTLEKKALNDAIAYIRSLAELHGRNAEWAEKAVSEAASLPASEALEMGVIDLIAGDIPSLLEAINGREVTLLGQPHVIDSQGELVTRAPNWRHRFLAVITNPNVAYILMLVGIYGLILEFYNPGVGLPGVLGGICLLLAMYALQMMPLNYAGLALMILGIILMITEALSPSFGLFGIGGVIAFALGSTMLMDSDLPGYQVALPLILGISLTSLGVFTLVLSMVLRARRRPATTGDVQLEGAQAQVVDGFPGPGRVRFGGEIWQATSDEVLERGEAVTILHRQGMTLSVRKSKESE
ncbi:NfeD family protein [Ferrimonas balearica]|uniref:NfeD family protein n=1 Tax=Ferrimonas balearica TaxID=44012 RepID=UPI001C9A0D1B|nr:nodulation protein NfeD [Ferrimonas balearica]MBY5920929.1 nodulation protein NfeD [Ferrimonas balearica]MBY5996386.1 nodulation protein NfeD [Ferrimonas balearica]